MFCHSIRPHLSLLLVFTILSMVGPRAVMAQPMGMVGMAHQMGMPHDQMTHVNDLSSTHAIAQSVHLHGHQNLCGCAKPCSHCGVCHATVPVMSNSGFGDRFTVPPGLFTLSLTEITIPVDPRPPRV